jgi:type III restriction enzyme
LNRKFERGFILNYLKDLPSLMVFNDEAHHIHDFKKEGEVNEVEWQKSLNLIATPKAHRFVQVDFSATPYNEVGTGKKAKKTYFPHIVVDFDLKSAMRAGLVKSLVLDKRREIGALSADELDFKAERDEDGKPIGLSEGQRLMLRAGLTKLKKLETEFAAIDPSRHPKMMVMCEDTFVTPFVEAFLRDEGLADDDILRVDSNKKGECRPDEWSVLREKLFDMDAHRAPRIIISVLMLREGFDVNNICVIVPLRSSQAGWLLEQTIGRGLRLMWRGNPILDDMKRDNRRLIKEGKAPQSLIDILSIVEHPAFQQFYEELMSEGLAGETDDDDDGTSSTGDLISVPLRDGYETYDFHFPFILREREETISTGDIDIAALEPFSGLSLAQLKSHLGKGEKFISEDVQTSTRFGDYRVDGGVMSATGYNDYVARLVRRIGELLSQPLIKSSKVFANQNQFPHLQVNRPQLAGWVDRYIKQSLFEPNFNPMEDENWRVLLVDAVTEHIIRVLARKLLDVENTKIEGTSEVTHRKLSEVERIAVRETSSVIVNKCIYPRLPYPSRSGGLEKAFIEMADKDGQINAFCKINEQKHDFVRLRYVKEDGLPAFYSPDFVVRTEKTVYLVETKAQDQLVHPNVRRKRKAALHWCERINELDSSHRMDCEWKYILLGEALFYEWRDKGESMIDMLDFAALRGADYLVQGRLAV